MSSALKIREKRKKEIDLRRQILSNDWDSIYVIHYSCESFYYKSPGTRSRITSVAVRNLAGTSRNVFSIHTSAIKMRFKKQEDIVANLEILEKDFLSDFFEFASSRKDCYWVHWNMDNPDFSFRVLEERFAHDFDGNPVSIPFNRKFDLANHLKEVYGKKYACYPRLDNTMHKNQISAPNFLPGGREAVAVTYHKYEELHNSNSAKVDVISQILELTQEEKLKTHSHWWAVHQCNVAVAVEAALEATWFKFLGAIALLFSLIQMCNSLPK
ncbi:MAG: hypothetical protein KIT34_19045 [Cyanobacteria bacterium TGS_CYA1]|nr:hypothetical protein [Cyanobacteria bacterium TGS_CYA1]